jgi:hypothetical protein
MRHPFEGVDPQDRPEARPMPCPECESTQGYSRVGNYRVQCLNCNALLKNAEVDMQLPGTE